MVVVQTISFATPARLTDAEHDECCNYSDCSRQEIRAIPHQERQLHEQLFGTIQIPRRF